MSHIVDSGGGHCGLLYHHQEDEHWGDIIATFDHHEIPSVQNIAMIAI
jgi:hypothetical protein